MLLSDIKKLLAQYEKEWSIRQLLIGDHVEVIYIKLLLEDLKNKPDTYPLSHTDLFKLVHIINQAKNNISIINALRNSFNSHLLTIMQYLDSVGMANEQNFSSIFILSSDQKAFLYDLLFNPKLGIKNSLNNSTSLSVRKAKLDSALIALAQLNIDHNSNTSATVLHLFLSEKIDLFNQLLKIFHNTGNSINAENISLFVKNNYIEDIIAVITELSKYHLANNENLKKLLELEKPQLLLVRKFVIKEVKKYISYQIDQDSFAALCSPEPAESGIVFDPHIHGVTSLLFSTLQHTNHTLMPPAKMLEIYQTAPFGGELNKDGARRYTGNEICFGRLNATPEAAYNLQKILYSYANAHTLNIAYVNSNIMMTIKKELSLAYEKAFININVLIIYLVRAKQLGISNEQLEQEPNIQELFKQFNGHIQLYYMLLLFYNHICPDFETLLSHSNAAADFYLAINTYLTDRNIINKIIKSNIDICEIYHNPSPEKLSEVINLLEIPNELILEDSKTFKKIPIKVTRLFVLSRHNTHRQYFEKQDDDSDDEDNLGAVVKIHVENITRPTKTINRVDSLLTDYSKRLLPHNFFEYFHQEILKHIDYLKEKQLFLNTILNKEYMKLTNQQRFFLSNSFPIVLICEKAEKFTLFQESTKEYRTTEFLKFGEDIKMIATDSEPHRLILLKYLNDNKIHHVSVVLFNDLYLSQETKARPRSPYSHTDGVPRLTWLSAKVAANNPSAKPVTAVNSIFQKAVYYNKLKLEPENIVQTHVRAKLLY